LTRIRGDAGRGGLDQPQPCALTQGEELGLGGVAGPGATTQRTGRLIGEVRLEVRDRVR
jgi:hypothetical protein